MLKRGSTLLAIVAAWASTGCTTPQQPDAQLPASTHATEITFEHWSWGNKAETWTIDRRTNLIALTVANRSRDNPAIIEEPITRTFQKPDDYFEKVWTRLEPVIEQAIAGVSCEGPLPTDQSTLVLRWRWGSGQAELNLYSGCQSPITRAFMQAIDDISYGIDKPGTGFPNPARQ